MISAAELGLSQAFDFITKDQERTLASACLLAITPLIAKSAPFPRCFDFGEGYKDHRVVRLVPSWLAELGAAVMLETKIVPDSFTIYEVSGTPIKHHTSYSSRFDEPVAILNLGAEIPMEFVCGDEKMTVPIRRRTLLLLRGQSLKWHRGTAQTARSYFLIEFRRVARAIPEKSYELMPKTLGQYFLVE